MSFTYVVALADSSADLDYVGAGALGLNGGTIRNSALIDAILTLPAPGAAGSLGANKNIVIFTAPGSSATSPPTTVNITAGGCGLTGAEGVLLLAVLGLVRRRIRKGTR